MKKLLLLISITSSTILNASITVTNVGVTIATAPLYGFGGSALSLKYIFKNYLALIKPRD